MDIKEVLEEKHKAEKEIVEIIKKLETKIGFFVNNLHFSGSYLNNISSKLPREPSINISIRLEKENSKTKDYYISESK